MNRNLVGLLSDEESLLPSAGLLGSLTGMDPAMAGLAQMQQQQGGGGPPRPPAAPQLPTPQRPRVAQPGPTGIENSPTRSGLMAGGIAALEANPGSYYTGPGPVIAAALKAGIPAYVAGKRQKADKAAQDAQLQEYQAMLDDPAVQAKLGPAGVKLARAIPPAQGIQYVTKILEREQKNIDPLSPEGIAAAVQAAGGKAKAEEAAKTKVFKPGDVVQNPDGTTTKIPDASAKPETKLYTAAALAGVAGDWQEWTPEERAQVQAKFDQIEKDAHPKSDSGVGTYSIHFDENTGQAYAFNNKTRALEPVGAINKMTVAQREESRLDTRVGQMRGEAEASIKTLTDLQAEGYQPTPVEIAFALKNPNAAFITGSDKFKSWLGAHRVIGRIASVKGGRVSNAGIESEIRANIQNPSSLWGSIGDVKGSFERLDAKKKEKDGGEDDALLQKFNEWQKGQK